MSLFAQVSVFLSLGPLVQHANITASFSAALKPLRSRSDAVRPDSHINSVNFSCKIIMLRPFLEATNLAMAVTIFPFLFDGGFLDGNKIFKQLSAFLVGFTSTAVALHGCLFAALLDCFSYIHNIQYNTV